MADFDKVCFRDGWHYSVVTDSDGNDTPGERLVLEDDGTYRAATDGDTESWNDRKHQRFASVVMEDASDGVRVNEEELAAVQALLAEMRSEG